MKRTSLIARLRARFVAWLLPDIEGHLIIRSINFNCQPRDPERERRNPREWIYPRLNPDAGSPLWKDSPPEKDRDRPLPRVPYQQILSPRKRTGKS